MHSVLMPRCAGGPGRERAQAGLLYYVNGLKMETAAMRAVQQEPHAPRAPRNARRWALLARVSCCSACCCLRCWMRGVQAAACRAAIVLVGGRGVTVLRL